MVRHIPNHPTLSPLFFLKRKRCLDFDFKRITFYPYARNALYNAFRLMAVSKEDNVLFPSFICNTAVIPVLGFTKNIKFYRITKGLEIDYDDLKSKIDKNTKAVLIVHYFGFGKGIEKVQSICKKNKLYLIEDCAQSLFSRYKGRLLGSFGDFAIFSLRKSLPIFEGAALVVNNKTFEVSINKKRTFKLKYNLYRLERFFELVKRRINFRLGIPYCAFEKRNVKKFKERKLFADTGLYFKMSSLSRFILNHSDSKRIIKQRRENFSFLLDSFKDSKRVRPVFNVLPEDVCPLAFPVLIEDGDRKRIWEEGVETDVHWNKLLPEQLDRKKFPDTDYIAKRELSFPVHQDLKKEHMEFIVKKLIG